jgi:phosphatidylglycerophosphate synthase
VDILMRYPRRYNVVLAAGLGITVGLAWLAGVWMAADATYSLKAAAFFVVLMAAILSVAGAHHPFARFGSANYVTTIRAMLAALVAGLIGDLAPTGVLWAVIGIALLAAALDGLDGWLARRSRMASAFGARFDMEVDAAFILVLAVLVWQHGKAGVWVLLCGLMRYAFVAAGRLLPWLAGPLRPTLRGRTVAVGQLFGLSVALAPAVPPPLSVVAAATTLAALAWSFAIDVMWLARQRRSS